MSERQIKPVADNIEKSKTYSYQKGRLNAAIKGGFYLEALLIDYALLEDRLRSYMFYIGLLKDRSSYKIAGKEPQKIKSLLLPIISEYKLNNEDTEISISSISGKIKIVRCIAKWTACAEYFSKDSYLCTLKAQFESLDVDLLLQTLDKIESWKDYRNEIIHGLMNKNLESLNSELYDKVHEGKEMAEIIDNQLKILKRGNKIRKVAALD